MSSSNPPIQNSPPISIESVNSRQPSSTAEGLISRGSRQARTRASNKAKQTRFDSRLDRKQRGCGSGRYNKVTPALCDSTAGPAYHHHRGGSSTYYRDPGTFHKFSKQQFLQANCQFVVLDGHDYSIHKADPDWPVDWDCIEEIRFKQCASTETTCPICLEFPVAAKITRCGHIYCWTCMLHYLSLTDENCRQCPICFEAVYKSDLRSVVSHSFTNYSVDDEIVMKLMMRKKGCVEVEPYESTNNRQNTNLNTSLNEQVNHYWSQANLVIVDSSDVISKIVQRERNELMFKLKLDKNEPEVCFIEQALNGLEKRVRWLYTKSSSNDTKSKPHNQSNLDKHITSHLAPESSKNYLFYQCSDGQHIYLNPFSSKILCHEFGNLESCPLEIRAKILQMDWISMNEAWRKRFKYLEHLPLTCEFRLIEIDFDSSNLISRETYHFYEDQIKRREQEREIRRKEERKREKLIQVEQNRKIYGIQPSLKINLDNIDQFPSVSDERYLGLSNQRNKNRFEEMLSSDDEEGDRSTNDNINVHSSPDTSGPQQPPACEIASVALSFKDIQLQEEAIAARSFKVNSSGYVNNPSTHWGNKNQSFTNSQSSFAQLLVDAKTSQKQWTRNVSALASSSKPPVAPNAVANAAKQWPTLDSDDGLEEELRAPPSRFTISDFIDINSATSSIKKKSKIKGLHKRG